MSIAKTFAPSKKYFFFVGGISVFFLLEGIRHIDKKPVTSALMILFGTLGLLFVIIVFLNGYQLQLSDEGLVMKFGSNQRMVGWADRHTSDSCRLVRDRLCTLAAQQALVRQLQKKCEKPDHDY